MAERRVNKADLAHLLGVTSITIGHWVNKGCPYVEKGGPGKTWVFDIPTVVGWREEQIALQAVGDTKSLDIDEARRRKIAAEAALTELDLSKRKGELVDIDEVAAAVGDDYANLRAKLLSLPVKLAPQVVGIRDAAEIQAVIESLIHEALEELVSDGIYATEGAECPEAGESQTAA